MTKKDYLILAKVLSTTAQIWIDARNKWIWKIQANKMELEKGSFNLTISEVETIQNKIDGINKILASLDVIVKGLSYELLKDNPKFDADKFRKACGLPEIKNNEIYPHN